MVSFGRYSRAAINSEMKNKFFIFFRIMHVFWQKMQSLIKGFGLLLCLVYYLRGRQKVVVFLTLVNLLGPTGTFSQICS